MSDYEQLLQVVSAISEKAKSDAIALVEYSGKVQQDAAFFQQLTASTRDPSAKVLQAAFAAAQKSVLIASKALILAAEEGDHWCGGGSGPVLKKVLTR